MALLEVYTYPEPILRAVAEPIEEIDDEIRELARRMAETMYAAPGIGLAAPQVGKSVRLIVVDIKSGQEGSELYILINPEIQSKEGSVVWEEGCLCLPDIREDVTRANKVVVTAKNLDGEEVTIQAEDLLAVCLQHEIDHLNGVLFIDHLSKLKQGIIKKKLLKKKEE